MSVKKSLLGLALLLWLNRGAAAQALTPATPATEVTVHGPQGARLLMDGQAQGKLPLPVNLVVPGGSHRFRLELGNQNAESAPLVFPESGHAELNLTLSGRTLVAVLRIADGLLLLLHADKAAPALRTSILTSLAAAASQEHSALIEDAKAKDLLRKHPTIVACVERGECPESLSQDGQVSYILLLRIDGNAVGAGTCAIHAALFDTRTRDLSAHAEEPCTSSEAAALSRQVGGMTAKLLQETAIRPRGNLIIASEPTGAKVLLDGRWIGATPLQMETFAGARHIKLQRQRYLPHQETTQIEPNQTANLNVSLTRAPAAPLPRPLWRIVTGSILLGGGLLFAGFGTSALLANGQCQDGSSNVDTCSPFYSTTGVGVGLLTPGIVLTVAGTLMIALPSAETAQSNP